MIHCYEFSLIGILLSWLCLSPLGMESIYTETTSAAALLLFSTHLASHAPHLLGQCFFVSYWICEYVTCACIRLGWNGFASLKCDPGAAIHTHDLACGGNSGMLNLRVLIHGNNTTGAACATIMLLKSVETALPVGVSSAIWYIWSQCCRT